MNAEQLIAAALASRAKWVDLEGGRRVRVRRPAEHDVRSLLQRDVAGAVIGLAADLPEAIRYVVGWEGFTEADFTPAGASDPVPFSAELWAIWVEDNRRDLATVAQAVIDAVIAHETARAGIEKN